MWQVRYGPNQDWTSSPMFPLACLLCESLFHILQCNNNENLHIFLACFYSSKLQYCCPNKFSQNFVINTATCTDKQSSTAFHKFILEFITFPYCLYSTSKQPTVQAHRITKATRFHFYSNVICQLRAHHRVSDDTSIYVYTECNTNANKTSTYRRYVILNHYIAQ